MQYALLSSLTLLVGTLGRGALGQMIERAAATTTCSSSPPGSASSRWCCACSNGGARRARGPASGVVAPDPGDAARRADSGAERAQHLPERAPQAGSIRSDSAEGHDRPEFRGSSRVPPADPSLAAPWLPPAGGDDTAVGNPVGREDLAGEVERAGDQHRQAVVGQMRAARRRHLAPSARAGAEGLGADGSRCPGSAPPYRLARRPSSGSMIALRVAVGEHADDEVEPLAGEVAARSPRRHRRCGRRRARPRGPAPARSAGPAPSSCSRAGQRAARMPSAIASARDRHAVLVAQHRHRQRGVVALVRAGQRGQRQSQRRRGGRGSRCRRRRPRPTSRGRACAAARRASLRGCSISSCARPRDRPASPAATPGRAMPAFSNAMRASGSSGAPSSGTAGTPRGRCRAWRCRRRRAARARWSRRTGRRGRPRSRRHRPGGAAKARKVAAVVTSKKLGPRSSPASSTSLSSAASSASEISLPAMRMRSL